MIVSLDENFTRRHIGELRELDAAVGWQPWSEDSFFAPLPEKFALSVALLFEGTLGGFLIGSRKGAAAHVHRIVVRDDLRGKGFGATLINALKERAIGARLLTLKVQKNNSAVRFYDKLGFRERLRLKDDGHHHLWMPLQGATVAVHQPNYLPWHGYFGKMSQADVFVFLDDVQMPIGRSYVSRTRIRLGEREQWLSVPVKKKTGAQIREIELTGADWTGQHRSVLKDRYGKWSYYQDVMDIVWPLMVESGPYLWSLNHRLIMAIADYLKMDPVFMLSSEFSVQSTADDRIIDIMTLLGVDTYISGTGGMNYQSVDKFRSKGLHIELTSFNSRTESGVPRPSLTVLESLFAFSREEAAAFIASGVKRSLAPTQAFENTFDSNDE